MKACREKSSKTFSNFLDFNSQFSCEKHPSSSHDVGICPHCLNDRLMQLVCSDCGERRRLSPCSCSQIEISRNSCSITDVGRISFLIDQKRRSFLQRSSSNRVGVEKSNGLGRIKRLFMKKRSVENLEFCDESGRNSCQNQMEFDRRSVFPIKERDSSGFIELKLESSSYELCGGRSSRASDHESFEAGEIVASLRRSGISGNGGSCRITMNERGLKQGSRRNYSIWKWMFKNGQK